MKLISVVIAASTLLGGTAAASVAIDAPVPGSLILFGTVLLGVFGVSVVIWSARKSAK